MVKEVMELLALRPGDDAIDCTFGGGGYTRAMLEATAPNGRVLALDCDPDAIARGRSFPWVMAAGERLALVHENFRNLRTVAAQRGMARPRAIVADLGLSTDQLGSAHRGFSFLSDGPLDMRCDSTSGEPTAADLLARSDRRALERILRTYGEEDAAGRIADAIVAARRRNPIRTVHDLVGIIESVVHRHGRLHPATKTFQALRITVNDELGALAEALPQMLDLVALSGRIAIVSFHSLEDRIVKQQFRAAVQQGIGTLLTKRPLQPSPDEIRRNPKSRSAKLRAIERREM
jgi:16S rRNA (cytosine1402-N4)-methyltransferase